MTASPLDTLRARIDGLDDQLLQLLEARASLVGQVAEAKRALGVALWDPARERALLERLAQRASGHFPPAALQAVYREIMSACLALQEPHRVAFLGPEGTFTHAAARELFGLAVSYVGVATIDGVFDSVRRADVLYGVVPIENSTEGAVSTTTDALLDGGVVIREERVAPIAQALATRARSLTEIDTVISHPQGLAQCRGWLSRNLTNVRWVQAPSTAQAVRDALNDPRSAAIASRLAAELNGLPVLNASIQDREDNATRFVVLARDDAPARPPTGRCKTTLAFTLADEGERGALRRALQLFDDEGLNLVRVESRPSRQQAWRYAFVVDIEGHREDPAVSRALERLEAHATQVRVLGSYATSG